MLVAVVGVAWTLMWPSDTVQNPPITANGETIKINFQL